MSEKTPIESLTAIDVEAARRRLFYPIFDTAQAGVALTNMLQEIFDMTAGEGVRRERALMTTRFLAPQIGLTLDEFDELLDSFRSGYAGPVTCVCGKSPDEHEHEPWRTTLHPTFCDPSLHHAFEAKPK